MNFQRLTLASIAVFACSGMIQASTVYNYAFGGLGNLGSNTHSFSPVGGSGPVINATGYQGLGATLSGVNLYSKGTSAFPMVGDENGLGLVNDSSGDHEITSGSFVIVDLGNLGSISSLGLYTESSTSGETWKIWGSQSAPMSGQSYSAPTSGLVSGSTEGFQNISSLEGDRYIFLTSTHGNILFGGLTATTPEPASAGLIGLALVCAGALARRRRAAKQS